MTQEDSNHTLAAITRAHLIVGAVLIHLEQAPHLSRELRHLLDDIKIVDHFLAESRKILQRTIRAETTSS